MNGIVGVIVGFVTALLSVFGFTPNASQLPIPEAPVVPNTTVSTTSATMAEHPQVTSRYQLLYFSGSTAHVEIELNSLMVSVGESKAEAAAGSAVDMGDGVVRGFGISDGICGLESCGFVYTYKTPGTYTIRLLRDAMCGEDGRHSHPSI